MPTTQTAPPATSAVSPGQFRHVRWLAGGTSSGKTAAAAALAGRFDLAIYSGDRAEHDWLDRCSLEQQPRFAAARGQRPGDIWRGRSAEQVFEAMAGRYGETIGFLVEGLLDRPTDRVVIVDYFGVQPRDLAPLLSWPGQAAFLIPAAQFRRTTLGRRYADPDRARANWGDLDPAAVLETRLARDALWDAEVTGQAIALGLPLLTIDGSRPAGEMAGDLAERFRLDALPPR
jgi:hypothetical protein